MKKHITILLLLMSWFMIHAQDIVIQPPIFAPFECTEFYKLYTGSISNYTNETFKTQLVIEVEYTSPAGVTSKLADGIITGNPSIDVTPGTTIIDNATYESIYRNRKITFYNKEIESLLSRTKCLPPGQYDVCLTLYPAGTLDGEQNFLTQTCYTREKEMLSQLILVTPFEEEEIKVDLPLFTWTAVTPFNPDAMYRIQIVEVLANQTPFHAFNANPVFFEKTGLKSNIIQYPVSARPLLPCRRYAWRVTYELNGGFGNPFRKAPDFLQESEIWEFSTPCEEEEVTKKPDVSLINPNYFKTNLENKGNFIDIQGEFLRFTCNFSYKERSELEFGIYDERMQLISSNIEAYNETVPNAFPDLPLSEFYGENRFIIQLPTNIIQNKPYVLIVSDSKSKEFLRFKKK